MLIGLCTPCRDGTVHHQHMLSVIGTLKLASRMGVKINHYTAPGCSILPRVRNRLAATALGDGCDWVIFADDDIAWNPPDFFKLTKHGVDVVAAAGAKRHKRWDEQPDVVVHWPDGTLHGAMTEAGRIWKVAGTGAGLMAIKADVFREMDSVTSFYTCEGDPETYPMRNWFWLEMIPGQDGRTTDEGEDYNFCRKWISVGGSCWVDPDIRLRHYDGNVCHDRCLADMETGKQEAA